MIQPGIDKETSPRVSGFFTREKPLSRMPEEMGKTGCARAGMT
jgi:hypothetical protein